jgi:hypothetical protein
LKVRGFPAETGNGDSGWQFGEPPAGGKRSCLTSQLGLNFAVRAVGMGLGL